MPVCTKCHVEKGENEFYRWWLTKRLDSWCRRCKQDYRNQWQKNKKRKSYEVKYRKNSKNLKAHYAHKAVYYAVKVGKLKKLPCEKCGTTNRVQGHHWNYDLPLDVKWLCVPCHKQEHVRLQRLFEMAQILI